MKYLLLACPCLPLNLIQYENFLLNRQLAQMAIQFVSFKSTFVLASGSVKLNRNIERKKTRKAWTFALSVYSSHPVEWTNHKTTVTWTDEMTPVMVGEFTSSHVAPQFTSFHSSGISQVFRNKKSATCKQNKPATLNPYYKTVRKYTHCNSHLLFSFSLEFLCSSNFLFFSLCCVHSGVSVGSSDSSSKWNIHTGGERTLNQVR